MDLKVSNAAPRISTGQQNSSPKSDKGPKEVQLVFHGVVTKLLVATKPASQGAVEKSKGTVLDKEV